MDVKHMASFTIQTEFRARPTLFRILDKFLMAIPIFYLASELVHFTFRIFVVSSDVVQRDNSPAADQRRVHFKVLPNSFIGMVPIQK